MAEFEIKLEVPRETARAVRTALEDGPVQKQQLHAIYLDTGDEVLRRHQLVLRLRRNRTARIASNLKSSLERSTSDWPVSSRR